jgi:hypothetical protein
MFSPPPANAPHETTQPLDPGLITKQAELAAANEKELAPLKFALSKAVASVAGLPHEVVTAPLHAAPDAPAGTTSAATTEPVKDPQPAASDTDTPTRGIPKPITDPGKKITGGWGDDGGFESQYYALDGNELRALIRSIWKELDHQLDLDLRFGIACCYPRVACRVTIEIGGAAPDASVNDVAFDLDSRVVFLSGQKVDDNSTPADQLRIDAGVERPYKRTIKTATGSYIVDRETRLAPDPIAPDPLDPGQPVVDALADPNNQPTPPNGGA